jgi:hypothetical protein
MSRNTGKEFAGEFEYQAGLYGALLQLTQHKLWGRMPGPAMSEHATKVRPRRKYKSNPALTPEKLEFAEYRGIPVEVIGENNAR